MWIDPQKINTTAPPGPSSSVKHADGLSRLNPSINDKVRMGQEAMARKRRAWADWIAIGEALQVGRAEVMRDTHTNQPTAGATKKRWLSGSSRTASKRSTRVFAAGSWNAFSTALKSTSGFHGLRMASGFASTTRTQCCRSGRARPLSPTRTLCRSRRPTQAQGR